MEDIINYLSHFINDPKIYIGGAVFIIIGILVERLINPRKKQQQLNINDAVEMFEMFKETHEKDTIKLQKIKTAIKEMEKIRDIKKEEAKDWENYARSIDKAMYLFCKSKGHGDKIKCPCCDEYRRRKNKEPLPRGDDYDSAPEIEQEKKLKNIDITLR